MPKKPAMVVLAILLLLGGRAFAFTIKTSSSGSVAHWPGSDTAIFYVVSPLAPGSASGFLQALEASFQRWEEKSAGNVRFVFAGQREEKRARKDGTNTLIWMGEEWPYGAEVVAMSSVWYAGESGAIEEVDIEFNARDYAWSRDGANNSLRIQDVAMHEIGHLLGIDHSFAPVAVMHDTVSVAGPVKEALSEDDVEALWFLYPDRGFDISLFDLPVLFYPRDFPGESPARALPATDISAGSRFAVLGGIDFDRDGYRSEILTSLRDERGRTSMEIGAFSRADPGRLIRLLPPRQFPGEGEVTGVSGIDLNRDGFCHELAVLVRSGGRETVRCYESFPVPDRGFEPVSTLPLKAPFANNVVGFGLLDADRDGFRDELAALRATSRGFALVFYAPPLPGEPVPPPQAGTGFVLPGLHQDSRLLGLAVLDADGDGEEGEVAVLEKTVSGEFWLHAFRLLWKDGGMPSDVQYLASAPAPGVRGGVLPQHLAAVDANGDGFFNEMVIFSSKK